MSDETGPGCWCRECQSWASYWPGSSCQPCASRWLGPELPAVSDRSLPCDPLPFVRPPPEPAEPPQEGLPNLRWRADLI